jgi:hypothetical protein
MWLKINGTNSYSGTELTISNETKQKGKTEIMGDRNNER